MRGGGNRLSSSSSAFTLAEGATHVATLEDNRFSAFTLAEVLVTLGIIGVVAALTLPTLIHKHRNKVMETQFKTAYSLISRATYQMYMEHEADFFNYINYQQRIPLYYKVVGKINKNDNEILDKLKMYTSNNYAYPYTEFASAYSRNIFLVSNGMSLFMTYSTAKTCNIILKVDTNGPYKGPNRYGYDLFVFNMCANGKIIGLDENADNKDNRPGKAYQSRCSFNPSDTNWYPQGEQCSYWAIRDNIPPDKSTNYQIKKSYWKNLP